MLEGVEKGWRNVRFDCSELVYLDSTGVGALIRVVQALRRLGGSVRCNGLRGAPRKVLEMSNILPLLNEERTRP
jgi:anti-anti-sigma factor